MRCDKVEASRYIFDSTFILNNHCTCLTLKLILHATKDLHHVMYIQDIFIKKNSSGFFKYSEGIASETRFNMEEVFFSLYETNQAFHYHVERNFDEILLKH